MSRREQMVAMVAMVDIPPALSWLVHLDLAWKGLADGHHVHHRHRCRRHPLLVGVLGARTSLFLFAPRVAASAANRPLQVAQRGFAGGES